MSKQKESSKYLSNDDILIISKPLAKAVGIAQSVMLRRIAFWIEHNETEKKKRDTHFHDNRWWMYNTNVEWEDDLEIYGQDYIQETLNDLKKIGLVLFSQKFNDAPTNRTMWYTINYENYDEFIKQWEGFGSPSKMSRGKEEKGKYLKFIEQWFGFLSRKKLSHSGNLPESTPVIYRNDSSESPTVSPEEKEKELRDEIAKTENSYPAIATTAHILTEPAVPDALTSVPGPRPVDGFVSSGEFAAVDVKSAGKEKTEASALITLIKKHAGGSLSQAHKDKLSSRIKVAFSRDSKNRVQSELLSEAYGSPEELYASTPLFQGYVNWCIEDYMKWRREQPRIEDKRKRAAIIASGIISRITSYGEKDGWLAYERNNAPVVGVEDEDMLAGFYPKDK